MKQKQFEDDRTPQWGPWSALVPTTQKPGGFVEVAVNESNGWITLIGHDNGTTSAWAQDMTVQQARWLVRSLTLLADVIEYKEAE